MSRYFPQSNRSTAEARHRSLCITFKFADETIHFLGTWPRSFSHKCLYSKLVRMANLCLSAFQLAVESAFQVAERRGRRDPDYPQNGRRRCGTPRCWRCWQESLFFFQEGSVLSVYFTRKLLILYTRSCNFWLASYPQIARSKRSSGSDFPSYLGILATINKTAVFLLPHQMEQVLRSTPVWSPSSTCRYGVAVVILSDNKTVGSHPLVVRFLKGIFELRTPQPNYNETWDVYKVLHYFKHLGENSEPSLKDLTFKLCALLLLISAQRVQTVHLISLSDINFHDDGCTIHITEKLKQSSPTTSAVTILCRRQDFVCSDLS